MFYHPLVIPKTINVFNIDLFSQNTELVIIGFAGIFGSHVKKQVCFQNYTQGVDRQK